ncbi:hypothetical protein CRENBAI_008956 [Crenichthys baileyi]|uniref:Uncharacterized protein n=1 Tax=Crenichthys baileyi TaxID=28760 RepID=A0AAV9S7C1_9TELE
MNSTRFWHQRFGFQSVRGGTLHLYCITGPKTKGQNGPLPGRLDRKEAGHQSDTPEGCSIYISGEEQSGQQEAANMPPGSRPDGEEPQRLRH